MCAKHPPVPCSCAVQTARERCSSSLSLPIISFTCGKVYIGPWNHEFLDHIALFIGRLFGIKPIRISSSLARLRNFTDDSEVRRTSLAEKEATSRAKGKEIDPPPIYAEPLEGMGLVSLQTFIRPNGVEQYLTKLHNEVVGRAIGGKAEAFDIDAHCGIGES